MKVLWPLIFKVNTLLPFRLTFGKLNFVCLFVCFKVGVGLGFVVDADYPLSTVRLKNKIKICMCEKSILD